MLLNLRQELSTAAGFGLVSPDCSDQILNSAAGGPLLLGHNEDNSGDLLNASYYISADTVCSCAFQLHSLIFLPLTS